MIICGISRNISYVASFSSGSRTNRYISTSRQFHKSTRLNLNRFLFDESELDEVSVEDLSADHGDDINNSFNHIPTVTLGRDDYRTIHAAKILGLQNGDTLRAGVVDREQVTDTATILWKPEGKNKKAQPTKNGDPPGSLQINLSDLQDVALVSNNVDTSSRVSLLLALPRPLALSRILPMVAQMGVDHLILSTAQKVPKDYFGSHYFRKPSALRKLLIEGLCQAGDVRIPKITIVKRLKPFLEDELDVMFPRDNVARVIAHPFRVGQVEKPIRLKNIQFPNSIKGNEKRILVAVGPEGGWAEDYELDLFRSHEFQQVTLGSRTLRSDVAVVSLLSLAHDVCSS